MNSQDLSPQISLMAPTINNPFMNRRKNMWILSHIYAASYIMRYKKMPDNYKPLRLYHRGFTIDKYHKTISGEYIHKKNYINEYIQRLDSTITLQINEIKMNKKPKYISDQLNEECGHLCTKYTNFIDHIVNVATIVTYIFVLKNHFIFNCFGKDMANHIGTFLYPDYKRYEIVILGELNKYLVKLHMKTMDPILDFSRSFIVSAQMNYKKKKSILYERLLEHINSPDNEQVIEAKQISSVFLKNKKNWFFKKMYDSIVYQDSCCKFCKIKAAKCFDCFSTNASSCPKCKSFVNIRKNDRCNKLVGKVPFCEVNKLAYLYLFIDNVKEKEKKEKLLIEVKK
jgi:hypothetical protein